MAGPRRSLAITITLMVIANLAWIRPANAQGPPTAEEIKSLPKYCQARYALGSAEAARWQPTFGRDWTSLHHYCVAINWLSRATRQTDRQARDEMLSRAINGLRKYASEEASATFPLMYELYYRLGDAASMLGDHGGAARALMKSIQLKPDYPQSYSRLIDVYRAVGANEAALKVVTAGLKRNPTSTLLQQQKEEIEGLIAGKSTDG